MWVKPEDLTVMDLQNDTHTDKLHTLKGHPKLKHKSVSPVVSLCCYTTSSIGLLEGMCMSPHVHIWRKAALHVVQLGLLLLIGGSRQVTLLQHQHHFLYSHFML